jgi:hypothetical protein
MNPPSIDFKAWNFYLKQSHNLTRKEEQLQGRRNYVSTLF